MTTQTNARAEQPLRHRKTRDRALVLPLIGLMLLLPPAAGIFHLEYKLFGVPFTLIYLFTVWALLIAGAAALSRRLRNGDEATEMPDAAKQQDSVT